jgi:hypothetical protein
MVYSACMAGEKRTPVFKQTVRPVGRDLRGLRLPGLVLTSSVVPLGASLLGAGDAYGVVAALVAFAAFVAAAVRFTNAPLVRRPSVEAQVDEAALRVGARRVARKALTRGIATPVEDGAIVQLRTSLWAEPIVLHFDDPGSARDLLSALELDAAGRTAHFWAQSRAAASSGFAAAIGLVGLFFIGRMVYGVSVGWPGALVLALTGLYAALTLGAALPVSVSVGLDGISIRRVTGSEFLPWSRITKVTAVRKKSVVMDAGALEIEVVGKTRPLRLPLATDQIAADTPERLAARIEEARLAAARERASLNLSGSKEERVRAARAVLDGAAGYREAQTSPEAVHQLVLDPAADPEDRLAAAVALRDTDEGRARVRIAAATTAERSLRVAFSSALAEVEAAEAATEFALAQRRGR